MQLRSPEELRAKIVETMMGAEKLLVPYATKENLKLGKSPHRYLRLSLWETKPELPTLGSVDLLARWHGLPLVIDLLSDKPSARKRLAKITHLGYSYLVFWTEEFPANMDDDSVEKMVLHSTERKYWGFKALIWKRMVLHWGECALLPYSRSVKRVRGCPFPDKTCWRCKHLLCYDELSSRVLCSGVTEKMNRE